MTRPSTHARVTDALNRLDVYARDGGYIGDGVDLGYDSVPEDLLAIRHLVEALDRVLRAYPGSCDALGLSISHACEAVGIEGP